MGGFEFNKFLTAFLFSCLVTVAIGNSVDLAFSSDEHAVLQHASASVVTPAAASAAPPVDKATAAQAASFDVVALMSKADAKHGESISKKCAICHTFNKGGPNRVGPNLWNIVGSPKTHLGIAFNYSKPMIAAGGKWTYSDLFKFVNKPSSFVPGTRMIFVGIQKDSDIADLIAFLRSNSDSPVPLPSSSAD